MSDCDKFHDLLEQFSTTMLITHASDGTLHARPMAIAQVEPNCDVWFLSGADTAKAHEIEQDTHAHLVCQNDHSAYLSLSGTATVTRDAAKVAELWREPYRAWFPAGKSDPEIVLIHFQAQSGEYWDNAGLNKAKYMFETVKAYVTGTGARAEEGEQHGVVRF